MIISEMIDHHVLGKYNASETYLINIAVLYVNFAK